jgi:hypothetical protein
VQDCKKRASGLVIILRAPWVFLRHSRVVLPGDADAAGDALLIAERLRACAGLPDEKGAGRCRERWRTAKMNMMWHGRWRSARGVVGPFGPPSPTLPPRKGGGRGSCDRVPPSCRCIAVLYPLTPTLSPD